MVRLTDHLNMTIAVDWDVRPHTKQKTTQNVVCTQKKMSKLVDKKFFTIVRIF